MHASIRALLLLGLTAPAFATAPACGQSVATCDSVCALPGAPATVGGQILNPGGDNDVETTGETCASACSTDQTACTADGFGADFQAFLTCVANVGTYESDDCGALAATLTHECGGGTIGSTGTGGISSSGGGSTSSSSGGGSITGSTGSTGCAQLAACCATLPAPQAAMCGPVVASGSDATCTVFLDQIREDGFCTF